MKKLLIAILLLLPFVAQAGIADLFEDGDEFMKYREQSLDIFMDKIDLQVCRKEVHRLIILRQYNLGSCVGIAYDIKPMFDEWFRNRLIAMESHPLYL